MQIFMFSVSPKQGPRYTLFAVIALLHSTQTKNVERHYVNYSATPKSEFRYTLVAVMALLQ